MESPIFALNSEEKEVDEVMANSNKVFWIVNIEIPDTLPNWSKVPVEMRDVLPPSNSVPGYSLTTPEFFL